MAKPPPMPIYHHEDAERLAETWMRWAGYRDARRTSRGPDRGIDVRALSAVAQVKFHERSIGRPALQQLHGAAVSEGKPSLFFSYSGYSNQAIEFARAVGMALFDFDDAGVVRPVNREAKTIARVAEGFGPPLSDLATKACGWLVGLVAAVVWVCSIVVAIRWAETEGDILQGPVVVILTALTVASIVMLASLGAHRLLVRLAQNLSDRAYLRGRRPPPAPPAPGPR